MTHHGGVKAAAAILLAWAIGAAVSLPAFAAPLQYTPTGISRLSTAFGRVDNFLTFEFEFDLDGDGNSDPGGFNQDASVDVTATGGHATAQSSLQSFVSGTMVEFHAAASSMASIDPELNPEGPAVSDGTIHTVLDFTVASPSIYRLTGMLEGVTAAATLTYTLTPDGPRTTVFNYAGSEAAAGGGAGDMFAFDEFHLLDAGRNYQLLLGVKPASYADDLENVQSDSATADVIFEERPFTLFGDLNFDGTVNISDLALLSSYFGTTSTVSYDRGDANGDGRVNISDLALLAAFFGSSVPVPGAAAGGATGSIPEPVSAAVLLGALTLVRRRRRTGC